MSFHLSPDDLSALVKSMTPGEKRYFKLQSGLYSGSKMYMKLFDLLDRQQIRDEKEIKKRLTRETTAANFSVTKKYLFGQIIKSLKNYGTCHDSDSELNDLLETYKILQYKGMDRLSERVLQQAKRKAYEEDSFLRLCYILVIELIRIAHSTSDLSMDSLEERIDERRQVLGIIQNYSRIGDHLYLQRKIIRQTGMVRDSFLQEKLNNNIEPLMKMRKEELLSRTAEGMYTMALSDYYFAMGDAEQALHFLSGYISNQSFPDDTSRMELQHLNEYSNYFTLSLRSRHFRDFEHHLERFRSLISHRNTPIDIVIYERWLFYSATYLNVNGRFADASLFFREYAETIKKIDNRMTRLTRTNLYYAQAYMHFGVKEYDQALRYVFKVMDETRSGSELHVFARLLSILIYYETENWAALDYATRSAYRYLLKTKRLFRTEKLFLAFIRQLPSIQSGNDMIDRFSKLHSELETLFQDNRERDVEYHIHIRAWLKSKMEGVDFASCVKSQVSSIRDEYELTESRGASARGQTHEEKA